MPEYGSQHLLESVLTDVQPASLSMSFMYLFTCTGHIPYLQVLFQTSAAQPGKTEIFGMFISSMYEK